MQHGAKFLSGYRDYRSDAIKSTKAGFGSPLRKTAADSTDGKGGFSGMSTAPGWGSWPTSRGVRVTPLKAATLASTERANNKTNKQKERRSYEQSKRTSIQARRQEPNSRRHSTRFPWRQSADRSYRYGPVVAGPPIGSLPECEGH